MIHESIFGDGDLDGIESGMPLIPALYSLLDSSKTDIVQYARRSALRGLAAAILIEIALVLLGGGLWVLIRHTR
jgi:hypothetical protein